MAREIFISYSRHDKDTVFPFVKQINQALGNDCCWIDQKGIESGEEFEEVIMKAIVECKVVLFMLSHYSLESKWTKREVYYAEKKVKRIIPVVVNGDGLRGWFDFHFGNIDYTDLRSEEQRNKLIEDLKFWIGEQKHECTIGEQKETAKKKDKAGSYFLQNHHNLKKKSIYLFLIIIASFCLLRSYSFLKEWNRLSVYEDKKSLLYGYKKRGKVVIFCKWHNAKPFKEGLAAVQNEQWKYGYIDKTGTLVIPCKWDYAGNFTEGLAAVANNLNKWGFIDKTGEVVISCQWREALDFSEGLAPVRNGGKWGFIDKTGSIVIPCDWKDVTPFSGGKAMVSDTNGKIWFIEKTGRIMPKSNH